jgi:hypothetical protein
MTEQPSSSCISRADTLKQVRGQSCFKSLRTEVRVLFLASGSALGLAVIPTEKYVAKQLSMEGDHWEVARFYVAHSQVGGLFIGFAAIGLCIFGAYLITVVYRMVIAFLDLVDVQISIANKLEQSHEARESAKPSVE